MREIPVWVLSLLMVIVGGLVVMAFVGPAVGLFPSLGDVFSKPLHSCTLGEVFLAGVCLVIIKAVIDTVK